MPVRTGFVFNRMLNVVFLSPGLIVTLNDFTKSVRVPTVLISTAKRMASIMGPTSAQMLRELVECGICTNVKELQLFKCQHRVCKDCVKKVKRDVIALSHAGMVRYIERVYCPFCRRTSHVSKTTGELQKCRLSAEITEILKQLENNTSVRSFATQTVEQPLSILNRRTTHICSTYTSAEADRLRRRSCGAEYQVYASPSAAMNNGFEGFTRRNLLSQVQHLHERCWFGMAQNQIEAMLFYSCMKPYKPITDVLSEQPESTMRIKPDTDLNASMSQMVIDNGYKLTSSNNEIPVSFEEDRWLHCLKEQRSSLDEEIGKFRPHAAYNAAGHSEVVEWYRGVLATTERLLRQEVRRNLAAEQQHVSTSSRFCGAFHLGIAHPQCLLIDNVGLSL